MPRWNTVRAEPARPALFVNGKAAGTVTQVGGHSYIDLETVAQITNGTVTVEPNRILLNIPSRERREFQRGTARSSCNNAIVEGIYPVSDR